MAYSMLWLKLMLLLLLSFETLGSHDKGYVQVTAQYEVYASVAPVEASYTSASPRQQQDAVVYNNSSPDKQTSADPHLNAKLFETVEVAVPETVRTVHDVSVIHEVSYVTMTQTSISTETTTQLSTETTTATAEHTIIQMPIETAVRAAVTEPATLTPIVEDTCAAMTIIPEAVAGASPPSESTVTGYAQPVTAIQQPPLPPAPVPVPTMAVVEGESAGNCDCQCLCPQVAFNVAGTPEMMGAMGAAPSSSTFVTARLGTSTGVAPSMSSESYYMMAPKQAVASAISSSSATYSSSAVKTQSTTSTRVPDNTTSVQELSSSSSTTSKEPRMTPTSSLSAMSTAESAPSDSTGDLRARPAVVSSPKAIDIGSLSLASAVTIPVVNARAASPTHV